MPLVTAAGYPTQSAPTVSPSATPGGDYQQISGVSPDAFGAGVGRAQSQLGQTFERAEDQFAGVALEQQRLTNQVAADQSSNFVMDEVSKVLHGDPNKPGDVGYYGLKGVAAINARQPTAKALDDVIQSARNKLTNPRQQIEFDNQTRRMRNYWMGEIGRHYDQQLTVSAIGSAKAAQDLAGQGMASAAANGDMAGFSLNVENMMKGAQREGAAQGWTQEQLDDKFGIIRSVATKQWVESKAVTDPAGAKEFLEHNKDALRGDEYAQLSRMVKTHADHAVANEFVNKMRGGMIRGGATQGRISGGLNISDLYGLAVKAGYQPGQPAATAAAIAMAESSGNPRAHNTSGEDSYGLMQLNADAHGGLARTFDPVQNMQNSLAVSKGGTDWSPWTMYKNGEYRKYLPDALAAAAGAPDAVDTGKLQKEYQDYVKNIPTGIARVQAAPAYEDWLAMFHQSLAAAKTGAAPAVNRTGLPPLAEQFDTIEKSSMTPEQKDIAKTRASRDYTVLEADAARAERLKNESDKQQVQQVADEVAKDVYSASPKITPQMLANDPRLSSNFAMRDHLIRFINDPPGSSVPVHQSNANAMSLIERMQPNYTKPDKIVSMEQILEQTKGLNRTDWTFVTNQFKQQQQLGGETLRQQKAELIENYKGQIVGIIQDKNLNAAGYTRLYRYEHFVQSKLNEYQKAGKNPQELFDPYSPAFVAKPETLKGFQPSPQEMLRDPQTGAAVDLTKYSDTDLVAAVRQGKVDRNLARVELARRIEEGKTTPPPAAPIR